MKMLAETAKATGPKTAMGKAVCAANALRHGLRSDRAIVPAAGETTDDWEAFRGSVVRSLGPTSGIESALADRAASLLWRMNRVTGYETAVVNGDCDAAAEPADSPPLFASIRQTPEEELAGYRQRLARMEGDASAYRTAVVYLDRLARTALMSEPTPPLDECSATAVLECLALGCKLKGEWNPQAERFDTRLWGLEEDSLELIWEEAMLAACAERATAKAKLSLDAAVSVALVEARANIRDLEHSAANLQVSIDKCVPVVGRRFARKIGSLLLPPTDTVEKVIRYEGHLGRQLAATLQQLERLQAYRAKRDFAPPVAVHVTIDGAEGDPRSKP